MTMPVWPVGTKIERSPRRRASRSSSSETVIFPIAQSEPTVSTIVASTPRFAPVAVERSAGGRRRRAERERVGDGADDRDALLRLARPRRVEDRGDVVPPVAEHAAHRLPVVRVAREPLSEQQI